MALDPRFKLEFLEQVVGPEWRADWQQFIARQDRVSQNLTLLSQLFGFTSFVATEASISSIPKVELPESLKVPVAKRLFGEIEKSQKDLSLIHISEPTRPY